MKKLKILFNEPLVPRDITFGKFSSGSGNNTFSYGTGCIASYVKEKGYDVSYIDPAIEDMSYDDYINYIKHNKFDLIGIGSTTLQIEYAIELFNIIKLNFPKVTTVLGGVHASLMPQETMSSSVNIDYIVIGEGEKPFYQLIECLSNNNQGLLKSIDGICFRQNANIVINPSKYENYLRPEEIPIPLYDIFPMKKYIPQITYTKTFPSYSIIASRGCPFKCAFCNASATLGSIVRFKPVDMLLSEINLLKVEYGAKGIMFLDSNFTVNKKWLKEFCVKYLKSGLNLPWACNSRADMVNKEILFLMKEAGCWTFLFGIESANQKSLDLINKGTTVKQNTDAVKLSLDFGFYVYTSYIICLPGESEKDVLNTIKYAKKLSNHISMFYLPVPYPKTKLWEICKKTGGLREDARWSDFNAWDFDNPVYVNPLIGKEKMKSLYKQAYLNFYSNPIVWYRNLKELLMLRQSPYKYWLALKGFKGFIDAK